MTNEDWKSQADRLAHAMREHEARKKEAAETAEKLDPNLEQLKEETRRHWTLPVPEQVEVLKGMGDLEGAARLEKRERERGKAPRPLEPVRLGGYVPSRGIPVVRWQVWRLIPAAELWKAVALSLNIEPTDSLAADATRPRDQYSRLPGAYFDRLMVCQANLAMAGPIRPQGGLYRGMLSDPSCSVLMVDVAAFLFSAHFTLPDEMRAMVPAATAGTPLADDAKGRKLAPAIPAHVAEPVPGAAAGTPQTWTPKRLAELHAYREAHGTKEAAKHFGVSTARVRALLPSGKAPTKGYSAFTHRSK